ncbi:MAG TPA: hypothetical protein VFN75_10620 [Pseudonocardiaceae bacterium]|nr:hypothetical protein [Pseudonocardiaceae bacterium]
MAYAPVIAFDQAKRAAICRQLHHRYGITINQLAAIHDEHGDPGLHDLWTRERTLASLQQLTGHGRHGLDLYSTSELVELEQRTLTQLMGVDRRNPRPLTDIIRQRQHLAAWGIPA